jgi:hypothetical protein
MTDMTPIFAEIEALLDDVSPRALDEIEDTLTTGYAAALALEADRWRIERRITEIAAELGGEADFELHRAEEMVTLAQRLSSADTDLIRLRERLALLREVADAARAAA